MECTDNNKAATVVDLFKSGIEEFGLPSRVRGDRGVENVDVARLMIARRGESRGSFIAGRSMHNQRIEQLWAEVNRVLSVLYIGIFNFFEERILLDAFNEESLFALHFVFFQEYYHLRSSLWRAVSSHTFTLQNVRFAFQNLRFATPITMLNIIDYEIDMFLALQEDCFAYRLAMFLHQY